MAACAQVSGPSSLATFSDLPNELITKILCGEDEPKTRRRLLELRWVSRNINEVVRNRAVECIRLPKDDKQVEAMLTLGPNVFETATRKLHLEVQHYNSGDSKEWKDLAALIERMKGIQTIRLALRGPLNERVANALNSLPQLETLEVVIQEEPPGDSLRLPLPILANFKSISLELIYLRNSAQSDGPDVDDSTMGAISYLISNSPSLECLSIGPPEIRPLNFESMMAAPHWVQTKPLPLLRGITAPIIALPTSPDSANSLMRLSSLQIPNSLPNNASLWVAMRAAGINLQTIKVERLSDPLFDYLLGYRGLRAFHFGGNSSDFEGVTEWSWDEYRRLRQRLLTSGLLEHRATLADLRFCVSRDPSDASNWAGSAFCPSPSVVRCLHSYRKLERLDIVVDTKVGGLHRNMILTAIPALSPKLQTVCLRVIGLGIPRYSNGQEYRDTLQSVLQDVEQIRFIIRPVNWKALRVVIKAFDPHHVLIPGIPFGVSSVAYRVEKDTHPDGTCGLVIDPLVTELLSESARFSDGDTIL